MVHVDRAAGGSWPHQLNHLNSTLVTRRCLSLPLYSAGVVVSLHTSSALELGCVCGMVKTALAFCQHERQATSVVHVEQHHQETSLKQAA